MSGYDFTNKPILPTGVYAHHLYTQWNIGQSRMLQSMVSTGAVNLRDFNLNGAPLTGAISGRIRDSHIYPTHDTRCHRTR